MKPNKNLYTFGIAILYFLSVSMILPAQSYSVGDKSGSRSDLDPELVKFIDNIKAIDNHSHANTTEPDDEGSDALPLHVLLPFEIPARLRPNSPDWHTAYQKLYNYSGMSLTEQDIAAYSGNIVRLVREKGEKFQEWVLDQTGIEIMLTNRTAMGPGLSSPRFRWVSFVDAFLYPLNTKLEAATSPDREKLFPFEAQHLKNYLADLNMVKLPVTLNEYVKQVVTRTLENQKEKGCVAIKFEVGFLRKLDFDDVDFKTASKVYSKYINGGEPSHSEYKSLQDCLFRYIASEAGRLGMAVHIHSFPGPGNYYDATGSDPLLLEPVFNDRKLQGTKFILIHGGGTFSDHTSMMLWKSNVYADISGLTRFWTTQQLANVLTEWLSQYPEKILFGTDASSFGPGIGWELGAWIASRTCRDALALALTQMIRHNEITRDRAMEMAEMVMRKNANNLYNLNLN